MANENNKFEAMLFNTADKLRKNIDASEMGFMKDRVHREFAPKDIEKIEQTYHNWRKGEGYEDIKGYCKSAKSAEIEKHRFVLTPGRSAYPMTRMMAFLLKTK